jgi:hypothetical protein
MNRHTTSPKKHLSFDALRTAVSAQLHHVDDPRQQGRCQHSVHDAVMSGFACMFFQDPSMADFQRRMDSRKQRNNLRQLFDVTTIPKDSQLREVIDSVDSEFLRPIFKDLFTRLQRGKYLPNFQILPNLYICGIDGVYHHSSEKVHCDHCLSRTHRNGSVSYSHGVLQGALMHPDQKQIIPVMPEPIANTDGQTKQDCEINAAKRFVVKLKQDHPRLGLIITGDGLFSKAPMINHVLAQGMHYVFVAKPSDHTYMMDWLDAYPQLPLVESRDVKGRIHQCRYQNQVPLNGRADAPMVNYLHYQIADKTGRVVFKNSWVTDIEVTHDNVRALARGGRCRWKIENECFNTLKHQGYHLEHNFGHGKKHLSHNMYLLTLLAFYFHQIFELSDPAYQLCRRIFVAKTSLWEEFRALIRHFIHTDWDQLMVQMLGEHMDKHPLLIKK